MPLVLETWERIFSIEKHLLVWYILGHGDSAGQKVPTLVRSIGIISQVACGSCHTLALSHDGMTVWSFGAGDNGNHACLFEIDNIRCILQKCKDSEKILSRFYPSRSTITGISNKACWHAIIFPAKINQYHRCFRNRRTEKRHGAVLKHFKKFKNVSAFNILEDNF